MKRIFALLCALALSMPAAAPVVAKDHSVGSLDMYAVTVDAARASELIRQGFDVAAQKVEANGDVTLSIVLSPRERNVLRKKGIDAEPIRDGRGQSSLERAQAQAASGFNVWRSWDQPGGIRDELYDVAKKNAGLVKLVVLGRTSEGREIIALKVTQGAKGQRDGSRPAVLFMSNQHAREWISVEVNRRLLHWFIDNDKGGNKEIKNLLKSTELWFIISANPDGYQFTFDNERLWRKNLRDINGDGETAVGDGVDPNRNYDEHWNYDNEGSSSSPASDTYRGAAAGSEAETQAAAGLIRQVQPRLVVNFHSFGPLILFPQGWQVGTPDADNPIYTALGGTDANPGIPGFDPGLSAEELYVTNGETTDFADINANSLAFTPELEEGCEGCGFVFPDDEALVQAEFEKTLAFDLDIARSAVNPGSPVSHLGNTVKPFYLSQTEVDPENSALTMFDFGFPKSYGDPQEVRILAKRSLGAVTLNWSVNGGATHTASTSEWAGGERYGPGNGTYYHVMRGQVSGTSPGDSVRVWFSGAGATSDSFTYAAVSESGDPVLIMAAEDYTGASPAIGGTAPAYLGFYQDALDANGIAYDVYDVDAEGRTAPDPLGVLGHYQAVIWYTGDDIVTRDTDRGGGNGSRLAIQELYGIRDYLNEGGKVLYTGQRASQQYAANAVGNQFYNPFDNSPCVVAGVVDPACRPLAGSGDNLNDVIEYWFDASLVNVGAGLDPETGDPLDVEGIDNPLDGLTWGFNGADSAENQVTDASFITTSGFLPQDQYPAFTSWPAANYLRSTAGPFEPHSGDQYVYSEVADVSYKRITRTISVPAGGATMSFWTSYDTEADWDMLFVEAHTPGSDDWTTLPDVNGNTSDSTGESCPAGWNELHPFLDHYQTFDAGGPSCTAIGTTGSWNAASGSSGGWTQWQVDLGAYAGGQVELSIAYASDWATQGVGVFVDDIEVSTGEGSTDFESGTGGWDFTGPAPGSAANANNFHVISGANFPEGAVVATSDTLLMGFGFEGITGAETRAEIMGRVMDYLLP